MALAREELLHPSEWKLTAYGGFFREENSSIRSSILQRTLKTIYFASSHASNLSVWFQGRFCVTVQVDTVRVELYRQGKSLL